MRGRSIRPGRPSGALLSLALRGMPPAGIVGESYGFTPATLRGERPYSFDFSGTLPPSATFDPATGAIVSAMLVEGDIGEYAGTITVTDAVEATAALAVLIVVAAAEPEPEPGDLALAMIPSTGGVGGWDAPALVATLDAGVAGAAITLPDETPGFAILED